MLLHDVMSLLSAPKWFVKLSRLLYSSFGEEPKAKAPPVRPYNRYYPSSLGDLSVEHSSMEGDKIHEEKEKKNGQGALITISGFSIIVAMESYKDSCVTIIIPIKIW